MGFIDEKTYDDYDERAERTKQFRAKKRHDSSDSFDSSSSSDHFDDEEENVGRKQVSIFVHDLILIIERRIGISSCWRCDD
jgi:hypothetical protein